MTVELHCVLEHRKVRVRIAAYIDPDGKRFENVYNDAWNCRFPKDIREDGRRFHVPDENVKLQCTKTGTRFYSVSAKNIVVLPHVAYEQIYEASVECAICMGEPSTVIFGPCGHLCCCATCGERLSVCCICRGAIRDKIPMA